MIKYKKKKKKTKAFQRDSCFILFLFKRALFYSVAMFRQSTIAHICFNIVTYLCSALNKSSQKKNSLQCLSSQL